MHPPPDVLRAALRVLHIAGANTRNWTFANSDVPARQIHECWEALHPIPEVLLHWREDSEAFLRLLLAEHDAHAWAEVKLLALFDDELRRA